MSHGEQHGGDNVEERRNILGDIPVVDVRRQYLCLLHVYRRGHRRFDAGSRVQGADGTGGCWHPRARAHESTAAQIEPGGGRGCFERRQGAANATTAQGEATRGGLACPARCHEVVPHC